MPDAVTERILAFLNRVGIPTRVAAVPPGSFLPDMAVSGGVLVVQPGPLRSPGDLLHEAGHIAVSAPARRAASEVSDDPGEEMAAIAWSYAAALAAGVEPGIVFHAQGYGGGGDYLADAFAQGRYVGVPLLEYWGMTGGGTGIAYPGMHRWLRPA
jgi:hypothetical protein